MRRVAPDIATPVMMVVAFMLGLVLVLMLDSSAV